MFSVTKPWKCFISFLYNLLSDSMICKACNLYTASTWGRVAYAVYVCLE